jgi:[ribosomal protein S18]-alanine N-acetyltransferase
MSETRPAAHIRWMIRRDMPIVLAIEQASFNDPWTESDFVRCLRERNVIGMSIEVHGRIVGFMLYALGKDYLSILNIAVHPEHRRQGLGQRMVAKLIGKLDGRRSTLSAMIVDENHLGQTFFRAIGFKAHRVHRTPYCTKPNDGFEFRFGVNTKPSNKQAVRPSR